MNKLCKTPFDNEVPILPSDWINGKIPKELDFDIIAGDKWLFQDEPFAPNLEDIIVYNNGTGFWFAHKDSINGKLAGKHKRKLTVKERFVIELLRNRNVPYL